MKKINLILGVVALLLNITVAYAQVSASGDTPVNGSPYLDDAYVDGLIQYKKKSFTVPMRYNAADDVIEYQQGGKTLLLDPNGDVQKVTLGNSTFIPQRYELNGKPKFGFFTVLDSGKVILFAKKKITFVAAKKGGAMDGSDRPAQYKKSPDEFYYKTSNGALREVESIKSMIADFPDKQDELTQFAKKEKISPRKEKEIVQFVQYYNSL
jgi:hypothetical protein